jgi:hypothetical protein
MSADNWTQCPRCKGDWREDYEFYGAENGVLEVSYSGRCVGASHNGSGCGLEYIIDEAHEIYLGME